MLVTVIKNSVIYQGKIVNLGESFEAKDAIAKSLIERGYVKESNAEGQEPQPLEDKSEYPIDLNEMSYQELKKLASQMGLDTTGKKNELIARITEAQTNEAEEAEAEAEEADGDLPNTSMPE